MTSQSINYQESLKMIHYYFSILQNFLITIRISSLSFRLISNYHGIENPKSGMPIESKILISHEFLI